MNTHEVAIHSGAGGVCEGLERMLAIPELDSRFLHNRLANSRSKGTATLGSTPPTPRYKVHLLRIGINRVRHPSETAHLSLTILGSMSVSSTTAPPVLNLALGRRWPGRQLHAGIWYVSGASVFIEFATLVRVVFCL